MQAFPSLIGGCDQDHEEWIHMIKADTLLTDTFGAIKLKRDLDTGVVAPHDDDRVLGKVGITSPAQVTEALRSARLASTEWGATSLDHRFAFGIAFHEAFKKKADEFVEYLVHEGHPRRVAEWEAAGVVSGSAPETFDSLRQFMLYRRSAGARTVTIQRKPDGVVCLHPPKNAPASNSLLGVHALVGGNALVVKAPRSCPIATLWAWREVVAPVLDKFAPIGTLAVLCGRPQEIIDQWLSSPEVDDLIYFGGSELGLELEKRCLEHRKKPVLELSGNDGVLVWKDADVRRAAIAASECFYGSAQICMVPKYVLVHSDVAVEFERELLNAIKDIRPGLPSGHDALLSPVFKTERFFSDIEQAIGVGAEVVVGGRRTDVEANEDPSGVFLQPTVLRIKSLESARGLTAVREETFFPLLPVVVAEGENDDKLWADCLSFMNANHYGLRNSLWTEDDNLKESFVQRVHNGGILKINDSHLGFVDGMPTHGGTDNTGGVFGECNFPALRTTHLQAISDASNLQSDEVFTSARLPRTLS